MNKILHHPKPGTTGFFYGEFPEIPIKPENFETKGGLKFELGGDFGYGKALAKYNELFEACKEEAIKNGEIVNTDLLPVNLSINDELLWCIPGESNIKIKDGDTFDLPKGLKVQRINDPKDLDRLEAEGKDVSAMRLRSGFRLVPDVEGQSNAKGETQEELWKEALKLLFNSPDYASLTKNFTIQRKSK